MRTPSINAAAKQKGNRRVLNTVKQRREYARSLFFQTLEDRRLLASLMVLKFDGARDVVYDGTVEVREITEPGFCSASAGLGDREGEIMSSVRDELDHQFTDRNVTFTQELATTGEFSEVNVGRIDAMYSLLGSAFGLADSVGHQIGLAIELDHDHRESWPADLVWPNESIQLPQTIFLDFDGAQHVNYDGPVQVTDLEIPAFRAPVGLEGQEEEILASVCREKSILSS